MLETTIDGKLYRIAADERPVENSSGGYVVICGNQRAYMRVQYDPKKGWEWCIYEGDTFDYVELQNIGREIEYRNWRGEF